MAVVRLKSVDFLPKLFYNIKCTYRPVNKPGDTYGAWTFYPTGPFTNYDVRLGVCRVGNFRRVCRIPAGYKNEHKPVVFIGGVIAGFALGFYQIVRSAKQMQKDPATLKKADKKDGRS